MDKLKEILDWHEDLTYKWIERLAITEYHAMWIAYGKGLLVGLLLWWIFKNNIITITRSARSAIHPFYDDNHVHVEQVGSADDVSLTISQIGYGNTVNFSFLIKTTLSIFNR